MYRIHFSGFSAGTLAADLVMADGTMAFTQTLVVGVSAFYTTGPARQRQHLAWPPLTMLIRFDEELIRHAHNPFGYGLTLSIDGTIELVHPIQAADKREVARLETAARHEIVMHLRTNIHHRMPTLWQTDNICLNHAFDRYQAHQITLARLLDQLQSRFVTLTESQRQIGQLLIADAYARHHANQHRLDTFGAPRFMITKALNVYNSLYSHIASPVIKANMTLIEPDPKLAADEPYRKRLFNQYLATQSLLQNHQINPKPTQTGPNAWTLADLDTFMPLGLP